MITATTIMPIWCAPMRPDPANEISGNGDGNGFTVWFQMAPASE